MSLVFVSRGPAPVFVMSRLVLRRSLGRVVTGPRSAVSCVRAYGRTTHSEDGNCHTQRNRHPPSYDHACKVHGSHIGWRALARPPGRLYLDKWLTRNLAAPGS